MWQKTFFLVALVFFLTMNVLLWRSQYGQKDLAMPIPVETVTRRMFSATDDSSLEILHHGTKIGYCRWSPQTISEVPATSGRETLLPEGMIGRITGYSMSLDGTVMIEDFDRVRFHFSLELSTNFVWRSFRIRLATPDSRIEATSNADEETVQVSLTRGERTRQKNYAWSDLRNPQAILLGLGGGWMAQAWGAAGLALPEAASGDMALGLDWEAHADRQRMGDTSFPVYRVQTEVLGEYRLRAIILPSGELLRIELPDELVFINDKLSRM